MRAITNTILSIAALAMILSFALVAPSTAAGWGHMHQGTGQSMMHDTANGYGPYHGNRAGGHMGGGMMYGGHMMSGGHMYGPNTQGILPCDYTVIPQNEVPAPTPGQ